MAWIVWRFSKRLGCDVANVQWRNEAGRVRSRSLGPEIAADKIERARIEVERSEEAWRTTPKRRTPARARPASRVRRGKIQRQRAAHNRAAIASCAVTLQCEACGALFDREYKRAIRSNAHFCTRPCALSARKRAGAGAASRIEVELGGVLSAIGVEHRPQHELLGRYFVDEFLPDLNLAIEAQGAYWHGKPERVASDADRKSALRAAGYDVMDTWEEEFADLEALRLKIERRIRARRLDLAHDGARC